MNEANLARLQVAEVPGQRPGQRYEVQLPLAFHGGVPPAIPAEPFRQSIGNPEVGYVLGADILKLDRVSQRLRRFPIMAL